MNKKDTKHLPKAKNSTSKNKLLTIVISIILLFFFYFSLNQCRKDYSVMYEDALLHMEKKEFRECNTLLNNIIESNQSSLEIKHKSIFKLGEIYNFLKNYNVSISYFSQLLNLPIENSIRKNSLFMVAYIQNNKMDMYSESILTYKRFKKEYPNDDLIPSVEYELEQISKLISNALNK